MARDLPGGVGGAYYAIGDVTAIDISGTALTVALWQLPDVVNTNQVVIAKYNTLGSNKQYIISNDSDASVIFGISDNTAEESVDSAGSTLIQSQWNHIAGRKNGTGATALDVAVNGTFSTPVTSSVTIAQSTASLVFGRFSDSNSQKFNGLLAEVAIWDAALTNTEIRSLASGAKAPGIRPANLKGYWPLCGINDYETDVINNNPAAPQLGFPQAATHPFDSFYCDRGSQTARLAGRGAI